MEKQRKIISILLTFIMVLAMSSFMAGCGEDDVDPAALFDKASDNISKADTCSFDADLVMSTKLGAQSMDIKMGMDCDYIKPTKDDASDMQVYAKVNMELMGQKVQSDIYIKDGFAYSNTQGQKIKTQLPKESFKEINKLFSDKNTIKIEKYVKESSMDGDKIKLKVDGQKLVEAIMKKYSNLLKGNSSSLNMANGFTDQIKNSGIETVDIEATIKDENFTTLKCDIPMKMDGSAYGQKEPVESDILLDFKSIEVNPDLEEIEVPDADQYKTQKGITN